MRGGNEHGKCFQVANTDTWLLSAVTAVLVFSNSSVYGDSLLAKGRAFQSLHFKLLKELLLLDKRTLRASNVCDDGSFSFPKEYSKTSFLKTEEFENHAGAFCQTPSPCGDSLLAKRESFITSFHLKKFLKELLLLTKKKELYTVTPAN